MGTSVKDQAMLSGPGNCIIYNSINYNSDPKDNNDVILLQHLRSTPSSAKKVLEYYLRSEPIVKRIKLEQGEDPATWDMYYQKYVSRIIKALRQGNVRQAENQIFAMLDALESKY